MVTVPVVPAAVVADVVSLVVVDAVVVDVESEVGSNGFVISSVFVVALSVTVPLVDLLVSSVLGLEVTGCVVRGEVVLLIVLLAETVVIPFADGVVKNDEETLVVGDGYGE